MQRLRVSPERSLQSVALQKHKDIPSLVLFPSFIPPCWMRRNDVQGEVVPSARIVSVSSIRYRFSPLSIQSYLEGSSLGGPLYWDTLWLGGNIEDESHVPVGTVQSSNLFGVRQQFGCAVNFNGLFKSQLADGIIGLAPRGEYMWFLSFQRCPTLVIFKATFRVCVR